MDFPKPSEPHRKLEKLLGTWAGEEMSEDGKRWDRAVDGKYRRQGH